MFEWEVKRSNHSYLILLYRLFFRPMDKYEKITHKLLLKDSNIYYQSGNATMWFIDIGDFSHFETTDVESPCSNAYRLWVHTKQDDKHSIECTLNDADLQSMIYVISKEWCGV